MGSNININALVARPPKQLAQGGLVEKIVDSIVNGPAPVYPQNFITTINRFTGVLKHTIRRILISVHIIPGTGPGTVPGTYFGLNPINDIQVITPMYDGSAGTKNLNMELQMALNPSGEGISKAGRSFNVGDKVMQIVNDYAKDVFNGDIGRITRVDQEEHEIHVRFDDHEVKYDYGDLGDLVLAYAISIHKAQGSEYAAVVMPIVEQHYMMLQRNLLYTGITRGKKLVVVMGTKKAVAMAVRNNEISKRFTLLKQRLQR